MELLSYNYTLPSLTTCHSRTLPRRTPVRTAESPQWLRTPLLPSLPRFSALSSVPFDTDDTEDPTDIPLHVSAASLHFLQRVEAVRLQHSIRKHGHRFYVVNVYLRSTFFPIYRRDPDHQVEHTYASFFTLRNAIFEYSFQTAEFCDVCLRCLAVTSDMKETVHDIKRVVRSSKEKERRLEHFLHSTMQLFIGQDTSVCVCIGCRQIIGALSRFLKPQYMASTGII